MTKIWLLLLLAATLIGAGCSSSNPGSRDFVPGKGWTPN